jgi:hypothetical protein
MQDLMGHEILVYKEVDDAHAVCVVLPDREQQQQQHSARHTIAASVGQQGTNTHTTTRAHTGARAHAHTCTHMHLRTQVHTYTHTYTRIHSLAGQSKLQLGCIRIRLPAGACS